MTVSRDLFEFDSVVSVTAADGNARSARADGVWAPELHALSNSDGQHTSETDRDLGRQAKPWTLETGWTGQYGYNGPIMHPSEFLGDRMLAYIAETPGYWCVTAVLEDDGDMSGWVLCHLPNDELHEVVGASEVAA